MTEDQQRIAITVACQGIVCYFEGSNAGWYYQDAMGTWHRCHQNDPLLDLNAVHEAEKLLGEKRIRTYAFTLAQTLDTSPTVDLDDQFLNISATASQRAEAFLRTLNLWKD